MVPGLPRQVPHSSFAMQTFPSLFFFCSFHNYNPSIDAGGAQKMIWISSTSQQPVWQPWTLEHLNHERSILLRMAIDHSTSNTYLSALNSHLTFCKMHTIPVDPTPETLSYYIAFQSSFINPRSVDSYLSGICNQLETFYPEIWKNCSSTIVSCTLAGAKQQFRVPTK